MDESLPGLHPAIRDRHTSRSPFTDRQIPENIRATLAETAAREGAQLSFLTTPHRETVLDLIMHAEGYNRMDDGRNAEQRRWTHDTAAEPAVDDGIPDYA